MPKSKLVQSRLWLSHVLSEDTPNYGGGKGLSINRERNLSAGDSCNASRYDLPNHLGSHVDSPLHFIHDGKSVDEYLPGDWVFSFPFLVDIEVESAKLISPADLDHALGGVETDCDLLLIRTGFERFRGTTRYWKEGPGLSATLAPILIAMFPRLKAIGVDFISVSSFQHRPAGRDAHRALLGNGLRLFEDLHLAEIRHSLRRVIALPLRVKRGDGAPCTVIGETD